MGSRLQKSTGIPTISLIKWNTSTQGCCYGMNCAPPLYSYIEVLTGPCMFGDGIFKEETKLQWGYQWRKCEPGWEEGQTWWQKERTDIYSVKRETTPSSPRSVRKQMSLADATQTAVLAGSPDKATEAHPQDSSGENGSSHTCIR